MNEYFSSVFEVEDKENLPVFHERNFNEPLITVDITEEKVLNVLKELKNGKSQGPDQIHPMLLKETKQIQSKLLTTIFKKSLEDSTLPSKWKEANVTAIFKVGEKKLAENYRPISLTFVPCKLMEKLIRNALVDQMTQNNLFSKAQHGFISGKSCITQLLEFVEDVSRAIDDGEDVDVIYLDFKKAFNKVPHERLLRKLHGHGIRGKVYSWIKEFLSNRRQRVVVNGQCLDWKNVTSGIPQGSVLGPILFVIFINDMPDAIACCMKLYADDAKVYNRANNLALSRRLQGCVINAEEWALEWDMFFNFGKCKHVHHGSHDLNFR